MSKLNITKGEAHLPHVCNDNILCNCGFVFVGEGAITVATFHKETDKDKTGEYPSQEESAANAILYVDAHNTYNKCQLLPSELLQQRDELLEKLTSLVYTIDFYGNKHKFPYDVSDLIAEAKTFVTNQAIQKIENPNP